MKKKKTNQKNKIVMVSEAGMFRYQKVHTKHLTLKKLNLNLKTGEMREKKRNRSLQIIIKGFPLTETLGLISRCYFWFHCASGAPFLHYVFLYRNNRHIPRQRRIRGPSSLNSGFLITRRSIEMHFCGNWTHTALAQTPLSPKSLHLGFNAKLPLVNKMFIKK